MKIIKFKRKSRDSSYNIYTFLAVLLSIFIFSGLNIYINKPVAYLLVTTLSACSIYSAIKKASEQWESILLDETEIKFYFQNRMKEPLRISKKDLLVSIDNEKIKFDNVNTKMTIGQTSKTDFESDCDWDTLILYLKN
ncbi:MAG: hypothetical protein EAY68_09705 [Bacteroidetes bacterium]|nr:MAG: hypothetical protein EAY68_09705 [Bacteroidota bacterium]